MCVVEGGRALVVGAMKILFIPPHLSPIIPSPLPHPLHALPQLFAGLVAIAEGQAQRARQAERMAATLGQRLQPAPVRGLVLRGLSALTDKMLQDALQSLKHLRWGLPRALCRCFVALPINRLTAHHALCRRCCCCCRSLDLSGCHRLTNKSVHRLSTYRAQPSADGGATLAGQSGDEEDGWSDDEGEEGGDDYTAAAVAAAAAAAEGSSDDEAEAGGGARGGAAAGVPGGERNPAIRRPIPTALQAAMAAHLRRLSLREEERQRRVAASREVQGLVALSLVGLEGLMDDGLRALLAGEATKASLTVLDVSRCKHVTAAGLQLPPLVGVGAGLGRGRAGGGGQVHTIACSCVSLCLVRLHIHVCKMLPSNLASPLVPVTCCRPPAGRAA